MKKRYHYLFGCLTLLLFANLAQSALGDGAGEEWQQRRLMQPTQADLRWERAGHIMIYDGLTDRQVAAAMDGHFSRIQSMMFTGIVVTNEDGAPKTDPETGDYETENDGCD